MQFADPVIKVESLVKSYQMGDVTVQALKGIDLEIYRGEFVVLLGHSGSGKSTLLNIMGGLDRASSGEVSFFNFNGQLDPQQKISSLSDQELTLFRRNHIGFIFQMYNLIPRLTAIENIELITEIAENSMDPFEALKKVGLEERASHFPSQLSGGEQQRVAIARAIAKKPELLLCDEPTGALDVKTGIKVLEALQNSNSELGTTTIVITHNIAIADMAHRVIHLVDGKIKEIIENKNQLNPSELKW